MNKRSEERDKLRKTSEKERKGKIKADKEGEEEGEDGDGKIRMVD